MRRLPGSHAPNSKNRSSKNLTWMTKIRPAIRSLNNATVRELANNGMQNAIAEMNRRDKCHDKNEVRKQRYIEKVAKKRASKTK